MSAGLAKRDLLYFTHGEANLKKTFDELYQIASKMSIGNFKVFFERYINFNLANIFEAVLNFEAGENDMLTHFSQLN